MTSFLVIFKTGRANDKITKIHIACYFHNRPLHFQQPVLDIYLDEPRNIPKFTLYVSAYTFIRKI